VSRRVRPRRRMELEGKSADAATRSARPEGVLWVKFLLQQARMTIPDNPTSGACPYMLKTSWHNCDTTDVLLAPPTPHEPPFASSAHFEVLRHSLHIPFGQPRHTPPP
jgi:hypothetical protein